MTRWITLVWLCCAAPLLAQGFDQAHPRIWFPKSMETAVRQKIAQDPLATQLHQQAIQEADRVLDAKTCRYNIPDGRRLLAESRLAVRNVMFTAWAWRLTQDDKYRKRAVTELTAACELQDWNPSHFLDVAEMATAVAVGYDWLYPSLTPDERKMCEQALITKALIPAKKIYDNKGWWSNPHNNWSQVCGSGITIAAIAVGDIDQNLSADLFHKGVKLVESCVRFYEPNGMYPEGPGYWHYGTNYHVMLIAACEALKQPIDIPALLEKSGDSMTHLYGPTMMPFNFADGHADVSLRTPAQAWLATHFHNNSQSNAFRSIFSQALDKKQSVAKDNCLPLSILWLPPATQPTTELDTEAVYHGEQPVAIFRTDWSPSAAWLAIKGGTSEGGHSHMDVGSFCYEAHGQRWIHDLGSDNYNMPGYFSKQRFDYFRLQNRSHNTLEIDGKLQVARSRTCPLTNFVKDGTKSTATFDLSYAYASSASKVIRSAQFDQSSGISTITDDITNPLGDTAWHIVTDANCEIHNDSVVLSKKNQSITLNRLSPDGSWSVADATPPLAIENPNKGFRILTLTVPKKNRISIEVEIRP